VFDCGSAALSCIADRQSARVPMARGVVAIEALSRVGNPEWRDVREQDTFAE
jgi:hypothetical protein